jgi:glucose/arabinose dehydrogenase
MLKLPMKTTIIIGLLALTLIGWSPQDRTVPTQAGPIKVETVARGLEHPWGLAFLPDGRMLVTERTGKLRVVQKDGTMSKSLSGVPKVFAEGLLQSTLTSSRTASFIFPILSQERAELRRRWRAGSSVKPASRM